MNTTTETKPDTFTLYVPKEGSSLQKSLARGSAIVADASYDTHQRLGGGMVIVHYEGNIYGAENLKEYPERVLSAAGRLRERYPTSAMQGAYLKELIVIGSFHYPTRGLLIENREALQAWLGDGPGPLSGG
jgi:hypothetical protein